LRDYLNAASLNMLLGDSYAYFRRSVEKKVVLNRQARSAVWKSNWSVFGSPKATLFLRPNRKSNKSVTRLLNRQLFLVTRDCLSGGFEIAGFEILWYDAVLNSIRNCGNSVRDAPRVIWKPAF